MDPIDDLSVPPPPVEASIAFLASELVRERRGEAGETTRRSWLVAFAFGLLHGLGFAGALSEVGLPQNAIPLALRFFNLGVEAGAGALHFRSTWRARVVASLAVSGAWLRTASAYAIGGVSMFWTLQGIAQF